MPSVVNIDIQYNDLVVVHYIENEGLPDLAGRTVVSQRFHILISEL